MNSSAISMKYMTYLTFIICVLTLNTITAQVISTNIKGEKIVKFDDGSWRYYQEADSVLLNQNVNNEQLANGQQETQNNSVSEPSVHEFLNDLFSGLDKEIKTLELQINDMNLIVNEASQNLDAQKQAVNYDKTAFQIAANNYTAAKEKLDNIKSKINKAKKTFIDLSVLKDLNEISLHQNLVNTGLNPDLYNGRNADIILKDYLYLDDHPNSINENFNEPNEDISTTRNKNNESRKPLDENISVIPGPEEHIIAAPIDDNIQEDIKTIDKKSLYKSDFEKLRQSVASKPAAMPCPKIKEQRDPMTDTYRKIVGPLNFISYTPQRIRSFYKFNDLVVADSYMTKSKGLTSLEIKYSISSSKADQSFGGISKGNQLIIKFIDGNVIKLTASNTDKGKKIDDKTIYIIKYYLDNKAQTYLSKKLIDQVRVVWNAGYEDYPIYNIDALKLIMECLN